MWRLLLVRVQLMREGKRPLLAHGRLEEEATQYKHLHEPWQALHAAMVLAVHEAQRCAGPHGDTKQPLQEGRQPKVWTSGVILSWT